MKPVTPPTPAFGTKFVRLVAVFAFAFILAMPVSQGNLLLAVFGAMVVAAAMTIMATRRVLTLPVMSLVGLTLLLGVFGLMVGSTNPGFENALGVFVITPALFFICISALGQDSIRLLLYTCAIMTIVSGVYILIYVGGQLGVLPQVIPDWLLQLTGAGFGAKGDATSIRFYGLSTLAAAGPMWLASVFVKRDAMLPSRKLRIAAAIAGVSGAMVGGRRAIILVLILVPVLGWVMTRSTRDRNQSRGATPAKVIGVLGAAALGLLAFPTIASTSILVNTWQSIVSFFTGVSSDISADESIRTTETDQLIKAWMESPFLGHGLGAGVNGYQRSDVQPWQFEMQYQTLLMQTGVVGALIVVVMAVVVFLAIHKATKMRPDLIPSLIVTFCGGAAMLIANATNPYLQAPAHHWAIFLPLAVINMMLRDPAPALSVDMNPSSSPSIRSSFSKPWSKQPLRPLLPVNPTGVQ